MTNSNSCIVFILGKLRVSLLFTNKPLDDILDNEDLAESGRTLKAMNINDTAQQWHRVAIILQPIKREHKVCQFIQFKQFQI
jgi:hypothetical protein